MKYGTLLNPSSPTPCLLHCQSLLSLGSPPRPGTLTEAEQEPSNPLYGGTSNSRVVEFLIATLTTGTARDEGDIK